MRIGDDVGRFGDKAVLVSKFTMPVGIDCVGRGMVVSLGAGVSAQLIEKVHPADGLEDQRRM